MSAEHFLAYERYVLHRDQLREALDIAARYPEVGPDADEIAELLWKRMKREARIANEEAARGDS